MAGDVLEPVPELTEAALVRSERNSVAIAREPGRLRRGLARALSATTPGFFAFGAALSASLGSAGQVVAICAVGAGFGLGAALRHKAQHFLDWALGVGGPPAGGEAPHDAAVERNLPARVGAVATGGVGAMGVGWVLEGLFKGFGLPGAVAGPAFLVLASLAAIAIHDATSGLLRTGKLALAGTDRQTRAQLSVATATRLLGVAVELGRSVRAPLSGGDCLAATAVAFDPIEGRVVGESALQSELGLRVGDNLYLITGVLRVGGERCEAVIPAAGARASGEVAELAASHPTAELREYVIRTGDRIEVRGPALVTEPHRGFTGTYRELGEGPVLRGTPAMPVVITHS